ncbi:MULTISPECIES: phosphopantetheine-binding protein [unclassified Crossiella]|uniref:phosphopantetheine-binding protein n=1 Tax=unclassified Crossiella TaxID=2620835 RepID=UPI001FFFDC53|nr:MULTISPECIES: phosphopantetheine-binding protein [unclassified Crossiella]MCK2238536.1 acyl carrier protein [Crossiella sp. S99.2]MCK2251894.1 acyl carrier protein [Crossiella sp. S99.1]
MPELAIPAAVDADEVLAEVTVMIRTLLEHYGLDDVAIGRWCRFHDDLDLESIDLVKLATALRDRYGEPVNLAAFLAGLDLDALIGLTVGHLVDYLVAALRAAGTERRR